MSTGILAGYRVLDLSVAMAGPLAAMRLGDLGADVVKVEPTAGEWQRHTAAGGATGSEVNASFLSLNRNKRSLAVNLKSGEGRELLYELVRTADVFLQNYRPGVAARLGVDYETLRELRPELVYVSVSGYGETGPYAEWPGQDLLVQAMSGALFSAGRPGEPPVAAPFFLADAVTAYSAFEGVLAALLHRERTGEGQLVQVNMLDAVIAMQMQELSVHTVGGVPQTRSAEVHAHSYIRAPYGIFATADGYLSLAFADLSVLAEVLEAPGLAALDAERDGFVRRDEISAVVSAELRREDTRYWLMKLRERGIWCGPVYDYADVQTDPQVLHNGSFVTYEHPTEGTVTTPGFPYKFDRTPPDVRRSAPLTGQHTDELLTELGVSGERRDELVRRGVVRAGEVRLDPAGDEVVVSP
ncbi:crotonobetainyl-CoA:carnitine CoA-transferase CaiB-like acyl-CoA transferase [Kribbella sp. VKM Ac-2527]|uniref:Crotonobetainyl-CoA:carnitine CoA-transferase CaiB-like acyl-CoA transferase n=1 Tax=Kribbella caucasensis TaxID=2512215 RepID=A0A4R6KML0_9ACTN|nr:CoA transferase [Kribbella sp. VKM Ac-2527]TDO52491.1 crotonobetainyl-CoA:carnitine CoA-transferase CaiB-like acyl-CoA transferase [Kribbella sp. VKM Ac-2527]